MRRCGLRRSCFDDGDRWPGRARRQNRLGPEGRFATQDVEGEWIHGAENGGADERIQVSSGCGKVTSARG